MNVAATRLPGERRVLSQPDFIRNAILRAYLPRKWFIKTLVQGRAGKLKLGPQNEP